MIRVLCIEENAAGHGVRGQIFSLKQRGVRDAGKHVGGDRIVRF